jgi:hypothetical protein
MKSTILLLLLFHSTCLLGQAAFFTDDFETQDLSAWSSVDGNGNIGSAPYVHSGQCSFRATLPAAGGHVKLTEMFTASSSIYLQFFFYIDPAWTQTNSVDIAYIVGGEQVLLTKSSGKYLLGDNSGGQGTHYISVGIWHSLEMEWRRCGWMELKIFTQQTGPTVLISPAHILDLTMPGPQIPAERSISTM